MTEAPAVDVYERAFGMGITEAEMIRAYHASLEARPCACGGVVIADVFDPTDGVRAHQAEPKHQAWRAWMEIR